MAQLIAEDESATPNPKVEVSEMLPVRFSRGDGGTRSDPNTSW
jgi:hypothetical protein